MGTAIVRTSVRDASALPDRGALTPVLSTLPYPGWKTGGETADMISFQAGEAPALVSD